MAVEDDEKPAVLVVGAGPAGLTAAHELQRHGIKPLVVEETEQFGGISRTERRGNWRFDIGGHRFFTKVPRVESFWHEILPDGDFLQRPRMSRIYFDGKFFDYPLKATNALRNLGILESLLCVVSYLRVRLSPPEDQSTFEGWVAARFGWRLYRIFFKTYTEKVWGVPATAIQSDWAAQRIKNLSLGKAVITALLPGKRMKPHVTSLIENFQYPKLGPGMMWEACATQVTNGGSEIRINTRPLAITRLSEQLGVQLSDGSSVVVDHLISSMPIGDLIRILGPSVPENVQDAAGKLRHRDFLTVALVIPQEDAFPDNWIYIHSPEVRVGRIQNYGSWSPYLVQSGSTCLGLEYFVSDGDEVWNSTDEELIDLARGELITLGLVPEVDIGEGFVVRNLKAYPVYDKDYAAALSVIRDYLSSEWPMLHPVGRNGMHRYNNQDHSMLTAMLTADNISLGSTHDVWDVNVDDDYHEEKSVGVTQGTGRAAPVIG